MDNRATTVQELEYLLNKFKLSSYNDVWALEQMHAKLMDLKNSFTSSSFGSEFTPTKSAKKKYPAKKVASSSDDSESSSLSDSESDSDDEPVPKKRASPAVFRGKKKFKSAKFGGGGGSSASESSSEDSEDEKPMKRTPKKLLKKKKDPNAPKRPMSAYLIFSNDKRAEVRMAHPDWKLMDIAKHLAAQWKEMPDSEKQIYQEKALQEKRRYEEEMRNYNPEESDGVKESPKKAMPKKKAEFLGPKEEEDEDEDNEEKLPKAKKLAARKDGPKRPRSAFMMFMGDKREEVRANRPELSFGELSMELASPWKALKEEDRKIYNDKAHADLERYQNELKKM